LNKAASLATLAASALLGVVLAYWSWTWFAPLPLARAPAAAEDTDRSPSASGPFGAAKETPGAASGSVRLTGIIAAFGDAGGHALLRIDGRKTVAVPQGEEVEPGLRLKEVHVDRVVLERNGVRETLAWPEKGK
jgi:general secretion pathway protein C